MQGNREQAESLEDLNKLIERKQVQKPAVWPYVIGSIIFPPVSLIIVLILAWKRGILYLILPLVTIVDSLLTIPFIFFSLIPLINVASNLTSSFGGSAQVLDTQTLLVISFSIFLVIVGLISGFTLRNKSKKVSILTNGEKIFLLIVIVLQNLLNYLAIVSVSSVIYNSPSSF